MTKIAYLRANQNTAMSQNKPPVASFYSPPKPTGPVMSFPAPRINGMMAPKPLMMTPTTRFNTNPSVLLSDQNGGGRISKPLMEKRRRARINQCLSQLKMVVVDSAGQYTQNNKCKLEKADILELTVKYVKTLHEQSQQKDTSYITGYSDCIRQLCEFISEIPEMESTVKQMLESHLNQCLINIQQSHCPTGRGHFSTPPSPAPSSESAVSSESTSNSPVSSGGVEESHYRRTMSPVCFRMSDEEEFDEDDEEESDGSFHHRLSTLYSGLTGPLNLSCPQTKPDDDEVWRPW